MSAGGAAFDVLLTWTSSTSPTSSASVPGRACRASRLPGSGACSSWYSSSVQPDQPWPPVLVRTCSAMSSSSTTEAASQVTPTAPYPTTRCGVLFTRIPLPWRAAAASGRASTPFVGAVSETSVTFGSTGAVSTVAGCRLRASYAANSAATAAARLAPSRGRRADDVQADDARRRGQRGHHQRKRQQLLARGHVTGPASRHRGRGEAHADAPVVGEEKQQELQLSHQSHWSPQENLSNYMCVITSRHADTVRLAFAARSTLTWLRRDEVVYRLERGRSSVLTGGPQEVTTQPPSRSRPGRLSTGRDQTGWSTDHA